MPLHVLIAGGGLGGLCLAQGLRKAGVSCVVYERGPDIERTGYRLHLNADGVDALRRCLPDHLFELHLRTSRPTARRQLAVTLGPDLTERITAAHTGPQGGGPRPYSAADRGTLHQILLTGIEDAVRFGAPVAGYRADENLVVLELAGGRAVSGDILVGADGIDSAVRATRLPELRVVDTGTGTVHGRTPLSAELADLLPEPLFDGIAAIADDHGTRLKIGAWRPATPVATACAELAPSAGIEPAGDYLSLAFSRPGRPSGAPDELHAMLAEAVRDWHPALREIVARADPASFFVAPTRHLPVPPSWSPGRVTLLGDAIHAPPPLFAAGANAALRGAAHLADALVRVATGKLDPQAAIGGYEAEMREYVRPILRVAAELWPVSAQH